MNIIEQQEDMREVEYHVDIYRWNDDETNAYLNSVSKTYRTF